MEVRRDRKEGGRKGEIGRKDGGKSVIGGREGDLG